MWKVPLWELQQGDDEQELEVVREGLTYITKDSHTDEPNWNARYLCLVSLPNNRKAVEAKFLRTEKL